MIVLITTESDIKVPKALLKMDYVTVIEVRDNKVMKSILNIIKVGGDSRVFLPIPQIVSIWKKWFGGKSG